jgi:PAS domain-containing protein
MSLLAATTGILPGPRAPSTLAGFLAAALCISLLVHFTRESTLRRAGKDARLRAPDPLREREQRRWRLVETVPSPIWCLGPDGAPSYVNKRLAEYLGFSVEGVDTPGMSRLVATAASVVHPDDAVALNRFCRPSQPDHRG